MLDASLRPASDRDTLIALAKLSTMVARRAEGDAAVEVQLAAYAEQARRFPADIVADVLNAWPQRSQWWPTWFELEQMLAPRLANRMGLLASLERLEREALEPPRTFATHEVEDDALCDASKLRDLARDLRDAEPAQVESVVVSLRDRLTAKRGRKGAPT